MSPTVEQESLRSRDHKIINVAAFGILIPCIGAGMYELIANGEVSQNLQVIVGIGAMVSTMIFYGGHTAVDLHHFDKWNQGQGE